MPAYTIRELAEGDLAPALELVWRVFSEFEAPEYSAEGVEEFRSFIAPDSIRRQMASGMRFWVCYDGETIIGVTALRGPAHISLLFVEKSHHRRGIARRLWDAARPCYREHPAVSVNSSPYAREAYRRLGFAETGPEQTVNGIRFIPMRYEFS